MVVALLFVLICIAAAPFCRVLVFEYDVFEPSAMTSVQKPSNLSVWWQQAVIVGI